MDAAEFTACLGKTDDTPEVTQLLSKLGVTKKLRASRDGSTTDVEIKPLGVFLEFEAIDPKSSKLTLTGVQIYQSEGGYKPFKGVLPKGLVFGDTHADVKAKLGKPRRVIKDLRREFWTVDGQEFMVVYGRVDDRLVTVTQSLLDK